MRDDSETPRAAMPVIFAAALAWATGLGIAASVGGSWQWLIAAAVTGIAAATLERRSAKSPAAPAPGTATATALAPRFTSQKITYGLWLVALGLTAAAWGASGSVGNSDLARYVGRDSQLMDVTGVVVDGPVVETEPAAGLAKFVFTRPRTRWTIAVEQVHVSGKPGNLNRADNSGTDLEIKGRLLVSLSQVDTRWRIGDRVRCQGWVTGLGQVMNPGERDSAATLRREGIVGHMWLKSRGNIQAVALAGRGGRWSWRQMRARWGQWARQALNAGMTPSNTESQTAATENGNALALIDAMVLGQRRMELEQVYPIFRLTGLAHMLSISGLHVGLVALAAWLGMLMLTGKPRWAATAALLAVTGYVWIVPWRVPIIRAGFMAGAYCAGLMWNRRMRSAAILGWIALFWLVIRPGDLFNAGFQLSYGIVAALLLWTDPVARWMLPSRWWSAEQESGWWAVRRSLVQYVAVAVVAWAVAMPIVAYQFQMINPLAAVVGVVMLPMLAGVLWLGLAKVIVGLIWPLAGAMMGGLLLAAGRWCVDAVSWLSQQPGMAVQVPQPSAVWTIAALAVVVAVLCGWFARRYLALAGCVAVLGIGLLLAGAAQPQATSMTCTALAVGDGSCFVIRSHGETWLFDCGSGQRRNVGQRVVVPALKAMGVQRIDTIVISHGDFDHFSGTLEVCDAMPVRRIVTTNAVLREAKDKPYSATSALIRGLRQRHQRIDIAASGWHDQLGDASVQTLWPPAPRENITFKTNNDGSLVMRFTVQTTTGKRRLMMNGDIQGVAMAMMQQRGIDVRADVTDLPHHGSFPPGVLNWLKRVHPAIVLQSTGRRKLRWDKWARHLDGITRLVTAWQGAVTVRFADDGTIHTRHFAKSPTGPSPR